MTKAVEPPNAGSAEQPPTQQPPRRQRRRARVLGWVIEGTLLTLGIVLATGLWALGNLHHPRIKPHLVQAALDYGGLTLTYDRLTVSPWTGKVHAEGLSFAQPGRFARHAPTWLSVQTLDGELDRQALLDGGIHLRSATLAGTTFHMVRDARDDTFGLLFPSDPNVIETPTPLSASLSLLRGLGVEIDALEVQLARAEVIEVEGATVISRATVSDVLIDGHLHEQDQQLDVALALRSPPDVRTQLTLMQTESAERDAEGNPLRAALDLTSELALDVSATVDDEVQLALNVEAWPNAEWLGETRAPLQAEVTLALRFEEAEGRTHVDLRVPSALGGLLQGHVEGELRDATPTTLRSASGRVDAHFDQLPLTIPGVTASGLQAALVLEDATLGAEGIGGMVDLEASLARADVVERVPSGHVEAARLSLETRASTGGFEAYALELDAQSFAYDDGAEGEALGARGEALILRLSGPTLDAHWVTGDEAAGDVGSVPTTTASPAPAPDVLTVTLATLALHADPASEVTLTQPDLRAEGVGLLREVLLRHPLNGEVSLSARALAARDGRDRVHAAPLRATVGLHGLVLEGDGMLGLGGELDVRLDGDARFATAGQSGQVRGLAPRLHVDLDAGSVRGDVRLGSLETHERGETSLSVRDAHLVLQAENLLSLAPPAARGRVHLTGRVGHVDSGGTSLGLPSVTVELRGDGRGYALSATGRVAELGTDAETFPGTHPLRVVGNADLRSHAYSLDARLGPSAAGAESAAPDPAGPDLQVAMQASLAPDGRTLNHHLEASARGLTALIAPYLPEGTQVSFDDASLRGGGALADALQSPARPGQFLAVTTDLARALAREQQLGLTLHNLRYASEGGLEASAPTAEFDARAVRGEDGTQLTLTSRLPTAQLVNGRRRADISGLGATLTATLPDLDEPSTGQFTVDVRAVHVSQNFVSGYPAANVHLVATMEATPVSVTLASLTLENPAGHTRLELTGAYEGELSEVRAGRVAHAAAAIYGREALGLSGTLEQDLAAFSGTSFARRARGTLRVPIRVESGDLSTFRVSARIEAHDVFYVDMASGLAIEGLEGEIPIVEVVTLTEDGYVIQASGSANPLGRARFPDVQPFLERDAFLSATRILLADQVLGPLAGNLRVEGTTVALDRLQVGYRGGVVTGQLEADLRPAAAYVTMRGNATGVHGREEDDLLDANFALRFAPETLALDGSLQLVRMSKSHLEALLDVLDPYREDTDINMIRALLPFGYPRFLRARVQDGLMDLELRLGGIAGVASIQDIRAIPISPLLDDYVAPIVDPLFRVPRRQDEVAAPPRREGQDEVAAPPRREGHDEVAAPPRREGQEAEPAEEPPEDD